MRETGIFEYLAIWAAKPSKHVRTSNVPLRVEPEDLISIQLLLLRLGCLT